MKAPIIHLKIEDIGKSDNGDPYVALEVGAKIDPEGEVVRVAGAMLFAMKGDELNIEVPELPDE